MPDDDFILTLPSRRHRHPNPIYTFIIHPERVLVYFFWPFQQSSGSPDPRPKEGACGVQDVARIRRAGNAVT